jgi:hypothetical protein
MAHTIRMFVDTDGSLAYIHHDGDDPSNDEPGKHLSLKPGKKVRWFSRSGNISIDFDTDSPFESGALSLSATQGHATRFETLLDPGRVSNPKFKYTATVGKVSEDPDIIIDNSGGGGGPKPKPKSKSKGKK